MKKFFFLILLLTTFYCGTNASNPVSDTDKDKIKGQVKELVNTFFKGCEEVNFDMAMKPLLDSPDFIYINNGRAFSYKECVDIFKPVFATFLNQKITIVDEKYSFPDESTVLYTANCTSLTNYKDGHAVLQDPTVMLFIFKKLNNSWKAIYVVESYIEKYISGESSKGLNQSELLNKFAGNWEAPLGKDTTQFVQFTNMKGKNILSLYTKGVTNGKTFYEGSGFWGYNAVINKIDLSVILSAGYIFHYLGEFTSPDKLELTNVNNSSSKFIFEIVSPDEFKETSIENNNVSVRIVKRVK